MRLRLVEAVRFVVTMIVPVTDSDCIEPSSGENNIDD